MLLAAEVLKSVSCYRKGEISLNQFEDWFRDNSYGMFGEPPKVRQMCLAIDAAFSELRYGALSAELFDDELAKAIRPFEAKGSNLVRIDWSESEKRGAYAKTTSTRDPRSGHFDFVIQEVA